MMTNPTKPQTARQVFAQAFKFYREQRGYSQARVADIAKVTRSEVDDWENGTTVPDSKAWELLKKMMNKAMFTIGPTRLQAISEIDAEKALVQRAMQRGHAVAPPPKKPETPSTIKGDGPLTTRPFAEVLTAVTQPKPVVTTAPAIVVPLVPVKPLAAVMKPPTLTIVPDVKTPEPVASKVPEETTPPGVPKTLLGETFDLSDAYAKINAIPRGWGTAEAIADRAAYAKTLIKQGFTSETIREKTREKFTVGVSRVTLKHLRIEVEKEALRAEKKATKAETVKTEATQPSSDAADADLISHARMIFSKAPNFRIEEIVTMQQAAFKRSLGSQKLYLLRDEARVAWDAKKPPVLPPTPAPVKAPTMAAAPAPAPVKAPTMAAAPAPAPISASLNDVEAAAEIILGLIPNLRTFTIAVDDTGEVTVSHTVREVKVTESSTSVKLKR